MKNFFTPIIVFITIISYGQNSTIRNWPNKKILLHKNEVIHHNYELDNTLNFFDADIVATYPKCQEKDTNIDKTNCFNTYLTIYTAEKLSNSNIIKNSHLKKGINRIRVLLIVDKNGKIQVKKVLGKWSSEVTNEISRIIETAPNLIPAKLAEKNIAVKYSIRIPFTIK